MRTATTRQFCYVSVGICALTFAVVAVFGYAEIQRLVRHGDSLLSETQSLVADVRPETRAILAQAKLGTFETRVALKALAEDLNSSEQQRARLATMRAGESFAALAEQVRADTLPRLNADLERLGVAISTADKLIAATDAQLNENLLPEATRTLAALGSTARTFDTDGKAILAEVLSLVQKGETSLDAVNKTLNSPLWLATLANVERSTANVADATKELPATAASVEKILKTAAAYQKPLLIASLLATLARALFP